MSKITVTTIAGQTSGSDANLVKIESGDTLQALSNATVGGTLGVTGETTLATHLNMGDNDKIKLGASADLQIYHDGNNSYIDDTGTGNLYIRASDSVRLQSSTGEQGVIVETDGAVTLYYDNSKKLETSASGVAITGNLTATGNLQTSGNLINGSINLTFPTVSGTISTEGFSIALATALG